MNVTIKALREQKGFSQTYLASTLKVSRQMYIKYECGDVEPPIHILKLLCSIYEVPYDFIIEDKLNKNSENQKIESTYRIHSTKDETVAAEPSSLYGYSQAENPVLENALQQLKCLSNEKLISVIAFMKLLSQNEIVPQQKNVSKQDFLKLCGKFNFDSKEIDDFRGESLI